jgi:hypothetical protein
MISYQSLISYKSLCCSAYLLALGLGSIPAHERVASLYSRLNGEKCSLESVERTTGASITRCQGVGGFQLLVVSDDERMSIAVIDLSKKEHPLHYWDVVTPSMSTLGDVAEWRIVKRRKRIVPIALIVSLKSLDQSDPEHPKEVSLIAVAKINDREICVVAAIPASRWPIERVRQEADNSADKACVSAP